MSRFAYEIIYSMCCMSVGRVSACDCRIRAESCQIWLNLWSTWRPNYVVRVVWKWIMDRDELIHFSIERFVEYDIVIKITFKWEAKKERSQMRKFIQEQKIIILHFLNLHQYVNDLRLIILHLSEASAVWFDLFMDSSNFFLIQKRLWQASKAVRTIWVIHIWDRI